jgi:hypothetical protein
MLCEERQLVAILLKLCCCQEPDTTSTGHTSRPSINVTLTTSRFPNISAMYQKVNICTPDKAALVLELVEEMNAWGATGLGWVHYFISFMFATI